jgi:hypothetical protein
MKNPASGQLAGRQHVQGDAENTAAAAPLQLSEAAIAWQEVRDFAQAKGWTVELTPRGRSAARRTARSSSGPVTAPAFTRIAICSGALLMPTPSWRDGGGHEREQRRCWLPEPRAQR